LYIIINQFKIIFLLQNQRYKISVVILFKFLDTPILFTKIMIKSYNFAKLTMIIE
jgi:hypothetical protein